MQETMQIPELSRISEVFAKPWILSEFLESAGIHGLLKERMAEIILGKFKKIYHIFLNQHSQQIIKIDGLDGPIF